MQWWRICLLMRERWVQCWGQEDPLEKEMAPHSSILAEKIPRREESGRLQSIRFQRARQDWVHTIFIKYFYLNFVKIKKNKFLRFQLFEVIQISSNSGIILFSLACVLIFYYCYNRLPQTWDLKNHKFILLNICKDESEMSLKC